MSGQTVAVRTEGDAAEASRAARELALSLGFARSRAVQLATAVSEIAVNQVRHAGASGRVEICSVERDGVAGVEVHARDTGPGIADLEQALRDGFSSAGSLGVGLSGARRLVDEFIVDSAPGRGTVIRLVAWAAAPVPPADASRLATWAVGGRDPTLEPLARPLRHGLLLALAPPAVAASLPDAPFPLPDTRAPYVAAWLSALDGRMTWLRSLPASGTLLRLRVDRTAVIASAPRHSAATVAALRGDVLILSAEPAPEPPQDARATPQELVAAASALTLVARVDRGALERTPRPA